MRFGVISRNEAINARIYAALEHIHPADVPKIVAKFRNTNDTQRFHTFRELLVGAHLRANGLDARFERAVAGKTPDWTLLAEGNDPVELIDVASIHQRNALESEMRRTVAAGQIWSGWPGIPPEHIYGKVDAKAGAYAELAATAGVAYTIFLHGEFMSCLDADDIKEVLLGDHGVFATRSHLSGVSFFTHSNGVDTYSYFENSRGNRASVALQTLVRRGAYAA
jgi:hypothetical protein